MYSHFWLVIIIIVIGNNQTLLETETIKTCQRVRDGVVSVWGSNIPKFFWYRILRFVKESGKVL